MADKKLNTRRLSFKQHHDLIEPQKSKEKEPSESTLTSPRMLSKSQKPHSPPKIAALQKSNSEKQSEINAEMKSLSPRKSLSPLNLNKLAGEINFIPSDEVVGIQSQEHLNTSPYKDSTISSTRITTPPDNITSHSTSKEPVSPSSAKIVRQASRAGALYFADLPNAYQDLIRKNNAVITSPKDLADLFFLVETECGKVEPNKNKMSTPFRSDAKIIEIPKEVGAESINLYEVYWSFLGKEAFDNEEIKNIRRSVVENYSKHREIYDVVAKDKSAKEIIESEIGFTVLKVIFDPLINHLMGGDILFNKTANEKIERQPSKLSKMLCEFIYTLDEKILDWCNEHKNANSNELILGRKNTFFNLIIFRGLIKIWTDELTFEDRNSTVLSNEKLALMKMLNSFLNANIDQFFEKIILVSDEEKKENIRLANKDLEIIIQQQKIESRKKEIMYSMSSVNLPKDKFLSKTGNRNSQPYYGSVRESLSPRHKSYSLSLSEKIQQQEKEQFIDEVIQKLNIPVLLADFKKDFKQSLLGLLGREIKIFEKRPFLTCKDHLMAYLAVNEDVQIKDVQGFMDKLNEVVKREVNEMEQEKRIKSSSKGEDNSPRKGGQELSPEKEKE